MSVYEIEELGLLGMVRKEGAGTEGGGREEDMLYVFGFKRIHEGLLEEKGRQ